MTMGEPENLNFIAENIILIRKAWKKTQTEMGELLGGATKAMIRSYEKGHAYPNRLALEILTELTGFSVKELEANKINIKDIQPVDTSYVVVDVKGVTEKEALQKLVGEIIERLVRVEAGLKIFSQEWASFKAEKNKSSFSDEARSLLKTIDVEADRMFSELQKKIQ